MSLFGLFKKKAKPNEEKAETKMKVEEEKSTLPEVAEVSEIKPVEVTIESNDKQIAQKSTANEKETKSKASVATPKAEEKTDAKPEEAEVTTAYTGRFEINKSKDGKKFFFNLYASNKVGIATSQMYSTSQSALNGVKSVIANAPKAPIEDQSLKTYETLPYPKWEIYVDNGGKYRFRLSASNGNCVCHSQGYTTKNACKNGIDSIIRSSKNAEIDKTYISKKDEE